MERRSIAKVAAAVAGASLPPHVSIQGNRFALVDGAGVRFEIQGDLNAVILDINEKMSRMYYGDRAYDPDNPQPPLCFSDNGTAPSSRSEQPQAKCCKPDPNGNAGCRWSVWGSATSKLTGEAVPACQNGLKMALMIVKPNKKDWVPAFPGEKAGMVFFLRVPPASLGTAANYARTVNGMSKLTIPWTGEEVPCDLNYVVTKISFVPKKTGTLDFHAVGYIGQEIDETIERIDQGTVDIAVGRDDQPIALEAPTAPAAAVAQVRQIAAPAVAPQPPAGEPAKRPRGRPPKTVQSAPAAPVEPQRDVAAEQEQEQREAESSRSRLPEAQFQFGMVENPQEWPVESTAEPSTEPSEGEDPLDQFMNLELK